MPGIYTNTAKVWKFFLVELVAWDCDEIWYIIMKILSKTHIAQYVTSTICNVQKNKINNIEYFLYIIFVCHLNS